MPKGHPFGWPFALEATGLARGGRYQPFERPQEFLRVGVEKRCVRGQQDTPVAFFLGCKNGTNIERRFEQGQNVCIVLLGLLTQKGQPNQ